MNGGKSSCLGDLHAAAAAVGDDRVRSVIAEAFENRLTDGHGDIMRGNLEPVSTGLAAATGVCVLNFDPRDHPQQLQAGATNALRPQMTRSMIHIAAG